ncbi:amidohydrolase [Kutzneria sp. CA-103260]|uniref:amidohydrolase n=1 Tax=Kutzneria sp. CA-103260 TaxID=2802641 RepID=UPI001BAA3425|nr:amidohydrolase [Kutzneria sp. CA-103260]
MTSARASVMKGLDDVRPGLEDLYRELHAHPELAFEEHRTAAEVARRAAAAGCEVTAGVGRTGVVALLRNGSGPTVLLRADMDALPVQEQTDLPYRSTVDGVMHACGHDMHTVCLLGALDLLARGRDQWSGTVLAVFQPAEEMAAGAKAMVDDGLYERFGRPDVTLGQHLAPIPAGWLGCHPGPAFAATDSIDVRLHGKGGHGSRPETTVDPVVMAASTVLRLQTVVSREVAAKESVVVTVGSIHGGTKDNIIPDHVDLALNVRTFDVQVRDRVLAAIERIIRGEATAAGAPREPELTFHSAFPVLVNDDAAMARTKAALDEAFPMIIDPGPVTGSEDFGHFGTAAGVPTVYWLFGGEDQERFVTAYSGGTFERDIPSNHSPHFAPLLQPTLDGGVTALVTAALAWLGPGSAAS